MALRYWMVVLCFGSTAFGQHSDWGETKEFTPMFADVPFKLTTNFIATCRSVGESKVQGISNDVSFSLLDYARRGNIFTFARLETDTEPFRVVLEGTYVLQNVRDRYWIVDYDVHGKWFSLDLSLRYQFLKAPVCSWAEKDEDNGHVPTIALGAFAGMRYVDTTLQASNFRLGSIGPVRVRLSDTHRWVEPFVGLETKLELTPKVSIAGEMALHIGQESELTTNFIGGLEYKLRSNVHVVVGYRYWMNDFDRGSFGMDLRHHGPFIGIGIRF